VGRPTQEQFFGAQGQFGLAVDRAVDRYTELVDRKSVLTVS